jgi:hypothetical protein
VGVSGCVARCRNGHGWEWILMYGPMDCAYVACMYICRWRHQANSVAVLLMADRADRADGQMVVARYLRAGHDGAAEGCEE